MLQEETATWLLYFEMYTLYFTRIVIKRDHSTCFGTHAFKVEYEGKLKSGQNMPILSMSSNLTPTFKTYSWISDHSQQFNCPGNTWMSGDFQYLLSWVKLAEIQKDIFSTVVLTPPNLQTVV